MRVVYEAGAAAGVDDLLVSLVVRLAAVGEVSEVELSDARLSGLPRIAPGEGTTFAGTTAPTPPVEGLVASILDEMVPLVAAERATGATWMAVVDAAEAVQRAVNAGAVVEPIAVVWTLVYLVLERMPAATAQDLACDGSPGDGLTEEDKVWTLIVACAEQLRGWERAIRELEEENAS